jgi:hypothetical protein
VLKVLTVLIAVLIAGMPFSPARAAAIIGTPGGGSTPPSFLTGWTSAAQTFVVPTGNDVLEEWTFFLAPRSDIGGVQFSIYDWSEADRGPVGSELISVGVQWDPAGGSRVVPMRLQLTSGESYAAIIDMLGFTAASVELIFPQSYDGGELFTLNIQQSERWQSNPTYDTRFRALFAASAATVPEPGSLALLVAALLGIASLRLRSRHRPH